MRGDRRGGPPGRNGVVFGDDHAACHDQQDAGPGIAGQPPAKVAAVKEGDKERGGADQRGGTGNGSQLQRADPKGKVERQEAAGEQGPAQDGPVPAVIGGHLEKVPGKKDDRGDPDAIGRYGQGRTSASLIRMEAQEDGGNPVATRGHSSKGCGGARPGEGRGVEAGG